MINFYSQLDNKPQLGGYGQIYLLGNYIFTNKTYLNFPSQLNCMLAM